MIRIIIGIILLAIGFVCVLVAGIWQQVLCFQMFGVVFEHIFIPHISALLYLGIIPLCVGWCMVQF